MDKGTIEKSAVTRAASIGLCSIRSGSSFKVDAVNVGVVADCGRPMAWPIVDTFVWGSGPALRRCNGVNWAPFARAPPAGRC